MTTSREVRLAAVPDGLPTPEHLSVVAAPLPVPGPGEVLVRNRFFQVFPALRTLFGGGVEGTPFPPLRPGDTLFGAAIGEVTEGPLPQGALVSHWLGWREYAAVPVDQCVVLDDQLPDPVAHLSQGLTAYTALTRGVEIRPGDTVFVSGGAGGIGSLAAQFAKRLGAGRVIGSTGSQWKADRMLSDLGYDAVVLRGAEPIADQLAKAAPDGIDVFLDNVGGDQLTAAIASARDGARFVLVGALSSQLSPDHPGTTAPVEVDLLQLIAKRIALRGLSPLDYPNAQAEWAERFGTWLRSGEVTFPHSKIAGIESAPRALHELLSGKHLGAVIVEL